MPKYADSWNEYDEEYDSAAVYPALRAALSEDYAEASPETLQRLVHESYPDVNAEDLESFFGSLSSFGRNVGQVAQRALPGVVQGATAGAALGPWGALAGGLAGGALSVATSAGGQRTSRPPRNGPRATPRATQTRTPVPPVSRAPASALLVRTLARPEVGQALRAMSMGQAGRRNISIGGQTVPVGAIANLLSHLLNRAAEEHHLGGLGQDTAIPAYLLDDAGEYMVDPTDGAQRAGQLLEIFAQADTYALEDESAGEMESSVYDWDEAQDIAGGYDDAWDDDPQDEALSLYPGVDYTHLGDD